MLFETKQYVLLTNFISPFDFSLFTGESGKEINIVLTVNHSMVNATTAMVSDKQHTCSMTRNTRNNIHQPLPGTGAENCVNDTETGPERDQLRSQQTGSLPVFHDCELLNTIETPSAHSTSEPIQNKLLAERNSVVEERPLFVESCNILGTGLRKMLQNRDDMKRDLEILKQKQDLAKDILLVRQQEVEELRRLRQTDIEIKNKEKELIALVKGKTFVLYINIIIFLAHHHS